MKGIEIKNFGFVLQKIPLGLFGVGMFSQFVNIGKRKNLPGPGTSFAATEPNSALGKDGN